jgi:PadR family transcriptional regulator PadR
MDGPTLGILELATLLAVSRLGEAAYGLAVRRDVSERMRRAYSVGAIYTTLQRLEHKGFITAHASEPIAKRGGRSRRQFRVTAAGRRALNRARRVTASVWTDFGSPLLERI